MQMIDTKGALGEYLYDPKRKIPKAHLDKVCKFGQGEKCCRFIGLGEQGYVCMKGTPMEATLTQLAIQNSIKAKGDNCEGINV